MAIPAGNMDNYFLAAFSFKCIFCVFIVGQKMVVEANAARPTYCHLVLRIMSGLQETHLL